MGRRQRAQKPEWGPRAAQHREGPPRKRRRVFLWVFPAVQILFLVWVISGATSGSRTPEECRGMTGDSLKACENAGEVGTTVGVGLVVGLWVAVDVILGFTYVVYRLAGRRT